MDFLNRTFNINLYNLNNPISLIQLAIGIFLGYYVFRQLYRQLTHMSTEAKLATFENQASPQPGQFEGQYYLKGSRSHKYCRDDPAGLICNDDFPSGWGLLTLKYHPDTETYTIKGPRNYYCSASHFGLVCDKREASTPAEHFKIIGCSSDTYHQTVKIYTQTDNTVLPVADHGNGLRGDHRDEQGYDRFKLIPAQFVANTSLTATYPRNERILPITGGIP